MKNNLLACLLIGIVIGSICTANATVITFDPINSNTTKVYPSYTESGFQFTNDFVYASAFGSWGSTESNYAGSQALFNNANAGTTFSKVGGGSFTLNSIDLSELSYAPSYSGSITVDIIGQLAGGGTVSYAAILDLMFGFETFNFGNLFSEVTSVYLKQDTYLFFQFDNVTINESSSPVPEPISMLLFGTGIVGIGGYIRKRFKQN